MVLKIFAFATLNNFIDFIFILIYCLPKEITCKYFNFIIFSPLVSRVYSQH